MAKKPEAEEKERWNVYEKFKEEVSEEPVTPENK